jgi:hypothetical protein
MRPLTLTFALAAALGVAGCHPSDPAEYPQGNPPGQYGPGQGYPNPGQWNPGQWQSGPPAPPPIPPGPPVYSDPVSNVDIPWLRMAAGNVLKELVAALPPPQQARVQGIPLVTDSEEGDINAFAACNEERMPVMAITDGLLTVEAYISQMRAIDEVFGTHKLDEYLGYLAQNQRSQQFAPPQGFVDPAHHVDYRKAVRQRQLMEEQMAFVLGHELAHHYLGHTGCANGLAGQRQVTPADLLRKVQRIVPVTNQMNELYSDNAGVNNLLTAGARRPGYHWTERGALLTLQFFEKLDKAPARSLVTVFLSSHPNPGYRVPKVAEAAQQWRQSGGNLAYPPAFQ